MTNQAALHTPQAVSNELDISPATLRRWADEFADYLSTEANPVQGGGHRRYTEADVQTLWEIKELMNGGATYEQVRRQIAKPAIFDADELTPVETLAVEDETQLADDIPIDEESTALVSTAGAESPAIAFLTNTLTTLSDTQQSILNSQAANRELLGVLIQDNFNLKEENNRLRERILDVERTVAQSRQDDEWRREAVRQELDGKIGAVQQMATEAIVAAQSVEMPEIKTIKGKAGCLGAMLGMSGDTQVVTVPRRRKPAATPTSAGSGWPVQSGQGQQVAQSPRYPKPTAPPE
jgi:DNA-binding transcriptional MerR regulator